MSHSTQKKDGIATWSHYLNRIKLFFRWLHNYHSLWIMDKMLSHDQKSHVDWTTPDFGKIKQKKTKRLSPYSETEIWERNELLSVIEYESLSRNKAIISLM